MKLPTKEELTMGLIILITVTAVSIATVFCISIGVYVMNHLHPLNWC